VAILHRDLRASDHDREAAVALLKAHYLAGRLGDHELAWRSDAAYRAVGVGELRRLTADLPVLPAPRRRRRRPVLPLALLALAVATWLVIVPPEVSLALVLVFCVLFLLAVFLLAPVWIPVLLAFVAYRLIRTHVSCR
jgi:ferric-dicitrate binding protein FerR (iron transport regulator)